MRFTTLIVDDEPLAREGLSMLLARDEDVSVIYQARDGCEAVTVIRDKRPDLIFLDVQMPEMDGFTVVKQIGAEHMPAVVFVTAHDRYAIDAFEINAVDYLLKPVTDARFTEALKRAKNRLQPKPSEETNRQILSLLETITPPRQQLKRLAVRSLGKTIFVDVNEVDWIGAAENYVELHTGKATHLLHVTMSSLAQSLDAQVFARIHRSVIVNVTRIKEMRILPHGEYELTLQSGTRLQSGRAYAEKLKSLLMNPF